MQAHEALEESVGFSPDQRLVYAVLTRQTEAPSLNLSNSYVALTLPVADVERWAGSDEVGLYYNEPVKLAIEKDFQCLHKREEGDADAYPNPLAEE